MQYLKLVLSFRSLISSCCFMNTFMTWRPHILIKLVSVNNNHLPKTCVKRQKLCQKFIWVLHINKQSGPCSDLLRFANTNFSESSTTKTLTLGSVKMLYVLCEYVLTFFVLHMQNLASWKSLIIRDFQHLDTNEWPDSVIRYGY